LIRWFHQVPAARSLGVVENDGDYIDESLPSAFINKFLAPTRSKELICTPDASRSRLKNERTHGGRESQRKRIRRGGESRGETQRRHASIGAAGRLNRRKRAPGVPVGQSSPVCTSTLNKPQRSESGNAPTRACYDRHAIHLFYGGTLNWCSNATDRTHAVMQPTRIYSYPACLSREELAESGSRSRLCTCMDAQRSKQYRNSWATRTIHTCARYNYTYDTSDFVV